MKYSANRSKNNKKYLIPGTIIAAILAVGILEATNTIKLFGGKDGNSTVNTDDTQQTESPEMYSPPTEEEKQQVDQNKANPENRPTNPLPDKRVVISSAEQDGNNVVVQTQLYGVGWQKCELSFTKGSETITRTADVLYQSEFSTCAGFSVPVSEFPSEGTWSTKLTASKSDGTKTTSDMKSVAVVK